MNLQELMQIMSVRARMFAALIACGALCCGTFARAESSLCAKEMADDDISHTQDRMMANLRLALFHADIEEMRKVYNEQDAFIKACETRENPPQPWVYCDSSCYRERANYWFFQASDLPVLSATGALTNSADILKSAQSGIEAIDKAKEMLVRENRIEAAADDSFNNYLRRSLALAIIEARLAMIMGDSAYQSASAAEATLGLNILVSKYVARETGLEGRTCSSHLCEARKAYENTFAVIVEAKGSLPRNSQDFIDEENQLLALESDLRVRMQSLDGGMMFLGVDPNGFTVLTQADLLQILSRFAEKLDGVENKIAAFIQSWKEIKARQEDRLDDRQREDRRYVNQNDINIKLVQIAKMEQQAKDYGDEVASRIETLKNNQDDFQARCEIRRIRFEIDQITRENQARQREVQERAAQDILLTDLDMAKDSRSQLRWMVHYQISLTSLENQVRGLDAQKMEYEQRTRKAENQKKIINNDNTKLQKDIEMLQAKIENLKVDKTRYEKTKDDIFKMKRQSYELNICQLEVDLAYLGAKDGYTKYPDCGSVQGPSADALPRDEYLKELCKVKTDLANVQIDKGIYIAKAVLGFDKVPNSLKRLAYKKSGSVKDVEDLENRFQAFQAPQDGSLQKVAEELKKKKQDVLEKKKNILDKKKQDCVTLSGEIKKRIEARLGNEVSGDQNISTLLTTLKTALAALENAAKGTSELHTIVAPQGSGTDKVQSPWNMAMVAWYKVKEIAELQEKGASVKDELWPRLRQLELDMDVFKQEVEDIDAESQVEDQLYEQTLVQFKAQAEAGIFDSQAFYIKGVADALDCNDQQNIVENEKKRIIRDHDMQVLNLNAAIAENDLINGDIAKVDREIKNCELQIANIRTQMDSNTILSSNQDEDITLFGKLTAVVEAQRAAVTQTIGAITGWNEEVGAITAKIVEQFAEKYRQIKDNASNAIEHLKELLAGAGSNAEASIAEIEKISENIKQHQDIVDKAIKAQKEAADKINAARNEVINKAGIHLEGEKSKPANDDRFLATEELMTRLVRGIPDYIAQKRNYLANINFVLGRLRNRAQIVGALGGHGDVSNMPVYVSNAASLERVLGRVCSWSSRDHENQRECTPSMDSAYYDDYAVVGVHESVVDIPWQSALIAGVNRGESVSFTVSTGIRSTADMQEKSYLALGPDFNLPDSSYFNSYLLDLIVEAQVSCDDDQGTAAGDGGGAQRIRMRVSHTGIGYVLDGDRQPNFVVSPQRVRAGLVYDLDKTDNPELDEDVRHLVSGGSWKESNLPQTDKDGNPLVFFGAPLFGDYKIEAIARGCAVNRLRLHFIHTVSQ